MNASPIIREWPKEDLQQIPECPVCGFDRRVLVHGDLTDVTFFVATGRWNLWRCARCGSGWLDPRPDEASIGRAYGNYYTHAPLPTSTTPATSWRHRLGNGYRNWRFGANLHPASRLGPIAALFTPTLRRTIDANCRYLPRERHDRRPRLLDYGCGNGTFLHFTMEAGWDCYGLEPDPSARAVARSTGADVRETLSDFSAREMFDAITMSHVVEHVHRPLELLRQLSELLRPGGFLYIQTPNFEAVGHQLFGRHWRGLEAPRHLVLFTPESLANAVVASGFHNIRFHDCPGALEFTQSQSRRIASGRDPNEAGGEPTNERLSHSNRAAAISGPNAEYITLTARKK